jgi:hypothetical protein
MLVVNFFAGPSAGKSTCASLLFGHLKMAGYNAELVTEFAKDLTWDESTKALGYQPYVFAQQAWRLERLRGKIDIVVTDSPLLMSLIYTPPELPETYRDYVKWESLRDPTLNFLIKRVKPFNPIGRNQTEEESKEIDVRIKTLLDDNAVYHELLTEDGTAPIIAFSKVVTKLSELKNVIV